MYRYLLETMQKEANRQKATYVIVGRESNTVYVRYGRGLTVTDEYVERNIEENQNLMNSYKVVVKTMILNYKNQINYVLLNYSAFIA